MNKKRFVFNKLYDHFLNKKEAAILLGARQVGKTTLLKMLCDQVSQKSPEWKIWFVNAEDPTQTQDFQADFLTALQKLKSGQWLLVIDEFYAIKNATRLFKIIYDSYPNVKVFASGSSSLNIRSHLKESLTGRHRIYPIFPFTYQEWLAGESSNEEKMEEFILFGGMPGLTSSLSSIEERFEVLDNFIKTYLEKDIKELIQAHNLVAYNNLLKLLSLNCGQILSISEICQEIQINYREAEKYLKVLEETFIFYPLCPFHSRLLNEIVKAPKLFLFDTGVRNQLINDFRPLKLRPDKGALIENYVATEILKTLPINVELKHWRTKSKQEVDFILIKNKEAIPIECKAQWNKSGLPPGLKSFLNFYPKTKMAIIAGVSHTSMEKLASGAQLFKLNLQEISQLWTTIK